MHRGMTQLEAVRAAKEQLGDVTAGELAAYVAEVFGLTIKPAIVTVLLGSLREREELERSSRALLEKLEQVKAEQPSEPANNRRRKKKTAA